MTDRSIRFYTDGSFAKSKREWTPEGFLRCRDVGIARTGTLVYGPNEVPIDPGKDGIVLISRDAEDVFSPESMSSFEDKPLVNDHPRAGIKVDAANWRSLAVGDVRNVRRGDGLELDAETLYADVIVKDAQAIQDILDGKIEVSAGYDAEYEQLEPGRGRQHDIIGNHVALVDKGRCGPRCAIGDSDTMATKGRGSFVDRIKAAYFSRDEGALVEELEKVPEMFGNVVSDEMPGLGTGGGHVTLNIHGGGMGMPGMPKSAGPMSVAQDEPAPGAPPAVPAAGAVAAPAAAAPDPMAIMQQVLQRLETLEQAVMMLAQDEGDEGGEEPDVDPDAESDMPEKAGAVEDDEAEMGEGSQKTWPHGNPGSTEDRRRARVGDSSSLATGFQDMLSRAAILAPGLRLPTFDAARGARTTFDTMCNFRRTALAKAWNTEDGREAIATVGYQPKRSRQGVRADFTRDSLTCEAATALFNAASAVMGHANTQDGQARARKAVMDHGKELTFGRHATPTIVELNDRNKAAWDATLGIKQ
jgi:uncharacterized protein